MSPFWKDNSSENSEVLEQLGNLNVSSTCTAVCVRERKTERCRESIFEAFVFL